MQRHGQGQAPLLASLDRNRFPRFADRPDCRIERIDNAGTVLGKEPSPLTDSPNFLRRFKKWLAQIYSTLP
jgi:hypothetical protein